MAIEKNRNCGTMTESGYWSTVRSALRKGFRFWKPIMKCKMDARRKYVGKNKKQKWEYQCAKCKKWYMNKDIQVDHIIPVGTLRCYEDLPGFVKRLTVEDGFQVLCKDCHNEKSNLERSNKKVNKNVSA